MPYGESISRGKTDMATRKSTPKYEVVHDSGAVALTDVSRTDATVVARAMNKGSKVKRLSVRPVKKVA
jgi:hypothetical protein